MDYAIDHTATVRDDYVEAHRRHFRFTFAQILMSLLLYAATSAILLGVGGWLVIEGQLTIGQLVAAEPDFVGDLRGIQSFRLLPRALLRSLCGDGEAVAASNFAT